MTDIDYAGLREKAEKASGGAWVAEPEAPAYTARQRVYAPELGDEQDDTICEAVDYGDAEFIAAANPQAVVALLDEIARLRSTLLRIHGYVQGAVRRVVPTFEDQYGAEYDAALIESLRDKFAAESTNTAEEVMPAGGYRYVTVEQWLDSEARERREGVS